MNSDQLRVYNTLRMHYETFPDSRQDRYRFDEQVITLTDLLPQIEAATELGQKVVTALDTQGRKWLYDHAKKHTFIEEERDDTLLSLPFDDFCQVLLDRMKAPHAPFGWMAPITSRTYTWEGTISEAKKGNGDALFNLMYGGALSRYEQP